MKELLLEVVEKALEKDVITRILQYDRSTDTATECGICTYLNVVAEIQFSFDEEELEELEYESYKGTLNEYLHQRYSFHGYLYPPSQRWGERLEILKEFRDYLKEEEELKDNIILLLQVVEKLIKDREVSKRKLSMSHYDIGDLIFVSTGPLGLELSTRMGIVCIFARWMQKEYPFKTSYYEYPPEGHLEERMNILEKFRDYLKEEVSNEK